MKRLRILLLCLCFLPGGVASAAGRPAVTLTDLWDGRAAWVRDAENVGAEFKFHYVSILREGEELWAFYIHNHSAADGTIKMGVGRARSTDGLRWTDDGMVLDVGPANPRSWDDRLAGYPGIWKDGDTWYLVYEGAAEDVGFSPGDIGLATSKDGKTFVKHPNNPILRHEPGGWERANVGTPSLFKEDGVWYLFYHGYDWTICQIGVASGKDLTKLTRSSANPILHVASVSATPAAWDTSTTGKRSAIVKEGDYYYFAFEGSTMPPFNFSKWSSGLARSKKLAEGWEKCPSNPHIPRTPAGVGNDGPELVKIGKQWFMYVRTFGTNVTERWRLEWKAEQGKP